MGDWDKFYLGMAKEASKKSKDPSTKVGAFLVRPDNTPISFGFNGFPRGMVDLPERYLDRDFKYRWVQHAERNALAFARESLSNCTMYLTQPPCTQCLGAMAQVGIVRVVFCKPDEGFKERWNFSETLQISRELGITLEEVDDEETSER